MDIHSHEGDPLLMAKVRKTRLQQQRDAAEAARRRFPPIPLKVWFKLLGVKAREVADAIGIDESTLSQVGGGSRQYMRYHLEDIAQYLSVRTQRQITPAMLLYPPAEPQLLEIITKMTPEEQRRAARILEASRDPS